MATISGRQLQNFRRLNKAMQVAMRAELTVVWQAVAHLDNDRIKEVLVDAVPDLIDKYGSASASVAAEWFEELVGTAAHVPDLYNPDAYQASTRWAISPLYREHRVPAEAFAHLIQASTRHMRSYGRGVIDESVARTPGVYYARVPTGATTCAFCLVMASRGPVYSSRESARYRASDGGRFHSDCDCEQVPMRGQWVVDLSDPRGYVWEGDSVAGYRFNDLYAENYAPNHSSGDSIQDVVTKMRASTPGMR